MLLFVVSTNCGINEAVKKILSRLQTTKIVAIIPILYNITYRKNDYIRIDNFIKKFIKTIFV